MFIGNGATHKGSPKDEKEEKGQMRKRVLGVLLCASLMVSALPAVALADPPEQTPPQGTPGPPTYLIEVECPAVGNSPNPFFQVIPGTAQHGSDTSLEKSDPEAACSTRIIQL
jgi:hypothetical protein